MFLTILFLLAALACIGYGFWLRANYSRLPKGSKYLEPLTPTVAFPFEPLSELVEESAKIFAVSPFRIVPKVQLSPAQYFTRSGDAFYLSSSNTIYVKDSFANNALPAQLNREIMFQLIHAWLQQVAGVSMKVPDDEIYLTAYNVMKEILGFNVFQLQTHQKPTVVPPGYNR